MKAFDAIRPFCDEEVAQVLRELADEPEFINAFSSFTLPSFLRKAPALQRVLGRFLFKRQTRPLRTVRNFQLFERPYVEQIVARTMGELTWSGIEHLDPEQRYLFISNHRDIALDPGLVNWVSHLNERDTVRIAIGDNLLGRDYVGKLMRLNKSFIVRRSLTKPRELLAAYKTLSAYIQHSVLNDRQDIWLAQREGRSKDGNDHTFPAVIKMLAMAREREQTFGDYLTPLNVTPLCISYEWDPCDVAKARELIAREQTGAYQKGEDEDLQSIALGIKGHKGRVHLAIGEPLTIGDERPDAIAARIDNQIARMYRLMPTNLAAYQAVHGPLPDTLALEERYSGQELMATERALEARLSHLDNDIVRRVMTSYAQPAYNKFHALVESDTP